MINFFFIGKYGIYIFAAYFVSLLILIILLLSNLLKLKKLKKKYFKIKKNERFS